MSAYSSVSPRFSGLIPDQYAAFESDWAAVGLEMKRKTAIASTFTDRRLKPSMRAIPRRIQVCPSVSHFVVAWRRQKKSGNLMMPIDPTKKKSCLQGGALQQ
ncbi:hypothetical protein J2T61_000544 [Methanocalculus sp. AMF5]|nr:hypothetical protein [Methanocalculus sp. AMF5]MCP1661880.1 hypothetical protein [Methanocalculus sp. AMF5]